MQTDAGASSDAREQIAQVERIVPAGVKALCDACTELYPDQPNPLQVTTRLKYWLGGNDPLDYISMYWNPGKPEENIPSHWHYVSFGLSDLHGDGRVHPPPDRVVLAAAEAGARPPSGLGLELTFRLAAPAPQPPPLWPAALLQATARYMFTTGNKFYAGDHISWHSPLDGSPKSRLRHLLVAEDQQLGTVDTPHGYVKMLQLVGCTSRELKAAQTGSGFEVLKYIAEDQRCGGPWHVTAAARARSARGVRRARGAGAAPAALAGVSATARWAASHGGEASTEQTSSELTPTVEKLIKQTFLKGLDNMDRGQEGHMSTDSFELSSIERALPQLPDLMEDTLRREQPVEFLWGVHLMMNPEAARLLPLAIDGRVRHSRHFTWRCGVQAITVLHRDVQGALADSRRPYAAAGPWLQILIPTELAEDMSKQVANFSYLADSDSEIDSEDEGERPAPPAVPLTLHWPKYRLKISVLHDRDIL
ncbi:suppressor of fused homolog [Amyelois transitella]|uniref:suppressor of fused homolog n=1 Tax=Amyelois transitella TaxID=680683 RepID=UPI00298F3F29|nr:suppressor of fused homolog [Amyelois transitella]